MIERPTPETDVIAYRFPVGSKIVGNDSVAQYNDLLDLARRLECERNAAVEALEFIQRQYGKETTAGCIARAVLAEIKGAK